MITSFYLKLLMIPIIGLHVVQFFEPLRMLLHMSLVVFPDFLKVKYTKELESNSLTTRIVIYHCRSVEYL